VVGDLIRAELARELGGDRHWIRTERKDGFVTRFNPEHLARVRSARYRAHVEEDVRNFRATLNRRRNDNNGRGAEQLGI
jgi:hypothetical protein